MSPSYAPDADATRFEGAGATERSIGRVIVGLRSHRGREGGKRQISGAIERLGDLDVAQLVGRQGRQTLSRAMGKESRTLHNVGNEVTRSRPFDEDGNRPWSQGRNAYIGICSSTRPSRPTSA
jgi:hypothetical protein